MCVCVCVPVCVFCGKIFYCFLSLWCYSYRKLFVADNLVGGSFLKEIIIIIIIIIFFFFLLHIML